MVAVRANCSTRGRGFSEETAARVATLGLSLAWINGPMVKIPVR